MKNSKTLFKKISKEILKSLDAKNVCLIMRGIPGSGKSTFSNIIMDELEKLNEDYTYSYCSADSFFLNEEGVYSFDIERISDVHVECYRKFVKSVQDKVSLIIIDNTNINPIDMSPYSTHANCFDYSVYVVSLIEEQEIGIERNIHNVPDATLKNMYERFNKNFLYVPKNVFKQFILMDNNVIIN